MSIPQTEKKLCEARFFLDHLSYTAQRTVEDPKHFDFYLSAFLNACYSVREVIKKDTRTKKLKYCRWHKQWVAKLSGPDRELFTFTEQQRGKEVHDTGAETVPGQEEISLFDFYMRYQDRYGRLEVMGSPPAITGAPPVRIEVQTRSFAMPPTLTLQNVTQTCARHLQLLEQWVQDFLTGNP